MDFIDRLGPLDGKPAAVFTTYKLAVGGTLTKMAARMQARGANVTGMFKSKGPQAFIDRRARTAWADTIQKARWDTSH